jgi:hypothetical protein
MKKHLYTLATTLILTAFVSCADNSLDEKPNDNNFPLQLLLDAEEGADLADAEDYSIEVKFADYLPDAALPESSITIDYTITDLEEDMADHVTIDKIIYEVEVDDCTYEREIPFTASNDGLSGTITLSRDEDLKFVPTSFEVILTLPGEDETKGSFKFELSNLKSSERVILGSPNVFEYEVLDNDAAGEWELEFNNEEEFEAFKSIFGPLNPELQGINFEDITGKVKAEFEFEEMKFEIELAEEEEITTCENGESETETENKVIEIEAEYEAEDGELSLEGSHVIVNDEGVEEDELDFIIDSEYEINEAEETITIHFLKVVDEDHFKEGEELFSNGDGVSFTFTKD